jgi:hypothetical protein
LPCLTKTKCANRSGWRSRCLTTPFVHSRSQHQDIELASHARPLRKVGIPRYSVRLRTSPHKHSPYGQQAKHHPSGRDVDAHRTVSRLDGNTMPIGRYRTVSRQAAPRRRLVALPRWRGSRRRTIAPDAGRPPEPCRGRGLIVTDNAPSHLAPEHPAGSD